MKDLKYKNGITEIEMEKLEKEVCDKKYQPMRGNGSTILTVRI